jgi:hypothetical protein
MAKKVKQEIRLKQEAQKFLAKVPEEYVFWCHDGRVLRDIKELAGALADMSDETFAYHSNMERKDFGNWVRDIIGDEKLAKDLEKAESRAQAAKQAAGRVATLTKRLA